MWKEWPLVAFTIAGQMAVGLFLVAGFPLFLLDGSHAVGTTREEGLAVLAVVLGLLVAAALLSFFHIHHPLRARSSLVNIRTSWLSREIFFELVFIALVAVEIVLVWGVSAASGLSRGVHVAAALAGILFLLSMIRLYMLETLPLWNQAYTPLSFALTALSLGAIAAGFIWGGIFILLSLAFVAAEIVISFLLAPGHGVYRSRPPPSLRPPADVPRYLHPARLASSLAGLSLLGAALIWGRGRAVEGLNGKEWLVAAFALVLAGQLTGRFLFYGLLARPGR